MYSRMLTPPDPSFFLFGPRGTGKSTWVRQAFPDAPLVDLLASETYRRLLASPQRLEEDIPRGAAGRVVIDEVQRVPELLNEVHRQIETYNRTFVLTGSSARKLRAKGVNLLAGRARTLAMHPLTAEELGDDFSLTHSLRFGSLPSVYQVDDPDRYLASYVTTYLEQEVQQEGMARNLDAFARFLEAASFSQAAPLNVAQVARDCGVHRKVVEQYFGLLNDLLLCHKLPVFTRRARRATTRHPKFFLFDAGVYRSVRPRGPLDVTAEIDGPALETLVFQHLDATNAARALGYGLYHWRTTTGLEVDFVLYGERGLHAIEVKRTTQVRSKDVRGLRAFAADYPEAKLSLLYGGTRRYGHEGIEIIPVETFLRELTGFLQ